MPDDVFGAMLGGLFRCDLSAQQLEMLHSYSPDLELSSAEVEESDDGDAESDLTTRYSVKGLNSSDARFCGPGMTTAALITRFHAGLPAPLQQLQAMKVMMLVRNPVDIVVARVQAKWVRGGPAWPACTLRSVDRCAQELCSSLMLMLRSLPSSAQRLRLLRWETFARRKQRVASDLLTWLGVTPNHTAVAQLMGEIDGELKAMKAVSDKYPLSPQSTYVVEQRCADVMRLLGYKPTAVSPSDARDSNAESAAALGQAASSSAPTNLLVDRARHSPGHRKRARLSRIGNSSASNVLGTSLRRRPLVLLQHSESPRFVWCPIRLAGAEPIMRFFVRRDTSSTAAAFCFPEAVGDRCPSRHGTKWHRRSWGNYPFEVVDGSELLASSAARMRRRSQGASPAKDFSFAFVRNPYDRLVSAYARHIVTQDKSTAVQRAWLREWHSLGDKDPITFSHFIRYVAQQDSSSMHVAWRPYSDTCQFDSSKFGFIGRLEHLERDMAHVMDALDLSSKDRQLWEVVSAKSRPLQPLGGDDRSLRLLHYYRSDDVHDLVALVRKRYKEDLRRFNYSFEFGRADPNVRRPLPG